MTHNQLIACDLCNTEISLRFQVGYYNIPFNIYCPKCSTHISGNIIIAQEDIGLAIELENAQKVNYKDHSLDAKYYIAELSAEFPTKKLHVRSLKDYDLSPYMRNGQFYRDYEKAMDATREAAVFAKFIKTDWGRFKTYFELYWNHQDSILYTRLEGEINKYDWIPLSKVTNDLDAAMALHQLLLTVTRVSHVLHPKALPEYTAIAKLMFSGGASLNEIIRFVQEQAFELNSIEKKAFRLVDIFSKIYSQLIPVVSLKNTDCLENVDREQYGITTASFETLTDFYAKSYEWILDNIDIVIGLNNILAGRQYVNCINAKKFSSVLSVKNKIQKLDYIDDTEPFSKPTASLKNRIRNAIQHFDSEIDYASQKITFTDKHAGKTKKEELYLIDFAALCLENFDMIFYLLELVYNLRKVLLISQGILPSCVPADQ
ncbi:MAG: hypothetical protein LBM28_04865 [Oscillospiraceae bacterium]|jgi:hypothetical protein|nr:hypothetical protein [Oscillospiraceae bacterium]